MKISIIIPCHNSATTIDRAVKSVFLQTMTDWELILVNNNSTDKTWEKLVEIKSHNAEKAIIVLDEKKRGAPAARNKGLTVAKGEWIQFLDADDELLPEKIAKQFSVIANKTDVIYSPYNSIKNKARQVQMTPHFIIKDDIWAALMMSKIGITSSNLFRRDSLLAVNGWDETLSSSQDSALAFALLKNSGEFLYSDTILTNVYSTEASITRTKDIGKIKAIIKNYIEVRKNILIFLQEKHIDMQKYKEIYNRVFADCYLWYFENAPLFTWKEYNSKTNDHLTNRLKTNYSFLIKLVNNPKIIKNIF